MKINEQELNRKLAWLVRYCPYWLLSIIFNIEVTIFVNKLIKSLIESTKDVHNGK